MSNEDLRAAADAVLTRLVGDPGGDVRLREDQWRAIEALVADHRRALVVQRTGWGKSAVYFVATALLRERGSGPTVIVSPLLALMRNQVEAAARAGIRARTINSANTEEWDTVQAEVAAGDVDVLLVSPERLNNPDFRDQVLPKLAATTGLLVVDEAHCISDWGHDFRPDYRRLRTMLADLPPDVPVLATTATANARVTADVAEQLGTGEGSTEALVLRGPLDRESLSLGVLPLPDAAHRLAWLADHLHELPGSGIIYTLTVAAAEEITAFLRHRAHTVSSYTGKTENADRQQAEDDLLANRVKALVATSALGMGFDKPDLGFVVHLGSPSSPIAYYQQVGRAGRGVEHAEVLLLPGREDEAIWKYFASLAFPPEEQVRRTLDVLAAAGRPVSLPALEPQVELRRSRLEIMLKVLDVDGAVQRVKGAGPPPVDRGRTTPSAMRGCPVSARPNSRRCGSTPPRRAAGWSSCGGSWTTRRRWRAAAATTAPEPGSPPRCPRHRWTRRVVSWGGRAWRSSRAGCGRRDCRPSVSISRGVSLLVSWQRPAAPWDGSPTSGGATGCVRCSPRRPRTVRSRTMWRPRWSRFSPTGRRGQAVGPRGRRRRRPARWASSPSPHTAVRS